MNLHTGATATLIAESVFHGLERPRYEIRITEENDFTFYVESELDGSGRITRIKEIGSNLGILTSHVSLEYSGNQVQWYYDLPYRLHYRVEADFYLNSNNQITSGNYRNSQGRSTTFYSRYAIAPKDNYLGVQGSDVPNRNYVLYPS